MKAKRRFRLLALTIATVAAAAALPSSAVRAAQDGITHCAVSENGASFNRSWQYRISLNVPKDYRCRVYIRNGSESGDWQYCWVEKTNVTGKACGHVVTNKAFTGWEARAVCELKNAVKRFNKQCAAVDR